MYRFIDENVHKMPPFLTIYCRGIRFNCLVCFGFGFGFSSGVGDGDVNSECTFDYIQG